MCYFILHRNSWIIIAKYPNPESQLNISLNTGINEFYKQCKILIYIEKYSNVLNKIMNSQYNNACYFRMQEMKQVV